MEKPSFINIPATMFYNSWMKLKGMSKEEGQRSFIALTNKIFKENNKEQFLENPYWPGPNYYDDC